MITIKQLINLQTDIPDGMLISGESKNTKLMFHKPDPKIWPNLKYDLVALEEYQKEHWNTFFAGTEYILSFWYEGKIARFLGCYELGIPVRDTVVDKNGTKHARYRFPQMKRIDFMSEYQGRLFIKWTNPSANYGRWINDEVYEVHSILPSQDNSIGPLPDSYLQIRLSFKELQKLFEYPVDNAEWKERLSKRSGVYLILDKSTGEQYIGAAYGENGFWGRWVDYSNKRDGNVRLANKNYDNFQFAVLWETLTSTSPEKVLQMESALKISLGTKVYGLN